LADWIIAAAALTGLPVQSTSIPGVAQRTGATTYYLEIHDEPLAALGGRQLVLALTPTPGDVDVVVASELLEAGRAMQNGFITKRTTLIASTSRVYAIGEGQNNEMFDYGYIEAGSTGKIIWQMTYSMTFHAGGGRKNRMVNTTILLDKGEYRLHYLSDDSHSFNHWNTDPPDDPTMWGITLYKEE